MQQQVSKVFLLYTILLYFCSVTMVASEVAYYFIRPSQTQSCDNHQHSKAACTGNDLTLFQFVNDSRSFLTSDTRLIVSPGNYSLESELIVDSIDTFSMIVAPVYSKSQTQQAVITCGTNARFGFSNVSGSVTLSGFKFVGCFDNYVSSVGLLQLDNSLFTCNNEVTDNTSVLVVEESTANLERVVFRSAIISSARKDPPDLSTNCTDSIASTVGSISGILLKRSNISIVQSWFEGNHVGPSGGVVYAEFGSDVTIVNTTFFNNTVHNDLHVCDESGWHSKLSPSSIVYARSSHSLHKSTVKVYDSEFVQNVGVVVILFHGSIFITMTELVNNEYRDSLARVSFADSNMSIGGGLLTDNTESVIKVRHGVVVSVDHCTFVNNTGYWILTALNTETASVTHTEFLDNAAAYSVLYCDAAISMVYLCEFVGNYLSNGAASVVYIQHRSTVRNLTNTLFVDNSAAYEVYIGPACRQGLGPSLGSFRCIHCTKHWRRDLIGILIAALIAGVALVIFLLSLNMTVAVGTLNGVLFYANVVASNAETYFLPFKSPDFVIVFISWLNLDIGFDTCFFEDSVSASFSSVVHEFRYKALILSAFPAYVIILVVIVIVASERSSKFARIVSKGNPVAVLATMVLLSYAKSFSLIRAVSFAFLLVPAYGSRNIDVTRLDIGDHDVQAWIEEVEDTELSVFTSNVIPVLYVLSLLLCVIYTALVFSWQWLLRYQDLAIFKWVRYQKLRYFLEPYHAPYTEKYRYWTGLLLFARMVLYLISSINFSLNPRVNLMAVIFVVGGLILLKGVTAKRVYKNWLLDVMETALYFNLVAFSALTWYNLDVGGNQVAVAYTSVMIVFFQLVGVVVFHVLRYSPLYKCSFVKKLFKWMSVKFSEKMSNPEAPNDAPEELDGYQLERSVVGDHELPTVTHSVIEMHVPTALQYSLEET